MLLATHNPSYIQSIQEVFQLKEQNKSMSDEVGDLSKKINKLEIKLEAAECGFY